MNIKQTDANKFILENKLTAEDVVAIDETNKTIVVDSDYTLNLLGAVSQKDLDLGSSGTAGTLDVFPATASKGKLSISATNNTGNTTTSITNAAFGQASTLTIPDPGNAAASFVLTKGAQTISGNLTLSGNNVTSGQLTLGSGIVPDSVSFSPAAGAANVCNVTITVKDGAASPAALATPRTLLVWLSDASTGLGATSTTASGTVTATTGTDLVDLTAKKVKIMQTNASGVIVLAITDTSKTGFYVCATPLGSPHGKHQVSAQLITGNYG